jgi:hypothetical protein
MADGSLPRREENRFPKTDGMPPQRELLQSDRGEDLVRAIDGLYNAFATCPLDDSFSCCPHCFTDADITYLRTTPLREFSDDDASFILGKAITTLGSARDFNHFLPRVLEAWTYHAHYMEHVIPEKLDSARQTGWTKPQEKAVNDFLCSFFRAANSVTPNTTFYYELSGEIETELRRQFPEIAQDLHVELRE